MTSSMEENLPFWYSKPKIMALEQSIFAPGNALFKPTHCALLPGRKPTLCARCKEKQDLEALKEIPSAFSRTKRRIPGEKMCKKCRRPMHACKCEFKNEVAGSSLSFQSPPQKRQRIESTTGQNEFLKVSSMQNETSDVDSAAEKSRMNGQPYTNDAETGGTSKIPTIKLQLHENT